jgi:phosphatidylglycerol:prolipoprotein diacylglycerol transferase
MYPRLLHFGNFSLYTYGVLVALALVVGLIITTRLAKRSGLDPDDTWNLGIYTVLCALLGAKVFLLVTEWNYFKVHPRDIFSFSTLQSGGVWFGGIIGGLLMAFFYMRRRHMPALKTCDVFAPGLALGHSIGRLGCFAAGCCYGKPTDLPWGVTFNNPLAYELVKTPLGVHLHPTQLYESGFEVLNFIFLM